MDNIISTIPQLGVAGIILAVTLICFYLVIKMFIGYMEKRDQLFVQSLQKQSENNRLNIADQNKRIDEEWGRWRNDIAQALKENTESSRSITKAFEDVEKKIFISHSEIKDGLLKIELKAQA